MLPVNALYEQINAIPGRIVEYKFLIENDSGTKIEYTGGNLVNDSINISGRLYSDEGFSVGGANSVKLEAEVIPKDTIKTMAEIDVFARLRAGNLVSDWLPQGIYYINTREAQKDPITGSIVSLKIVAYDAMLKADAFYLELDDPITTGWPKTMAAMVSDICQDIGVTLETGTVISSTLTCEADYSFTKRDYLSAIAKAHGGNFIITYEGKLRLVKAANEFRFLSTENYEPITFGGVRILV